MEIKGLEDIKDNIHDLQELALDLVGGTEDVGVVLCKSPDPGQAVELAALFVSINGAEFGKPQRQLPVTTWAGFIDFAVVGAVHRFEHVFLTLFGSVDRLERILAVLSPVSRGDVESLVADMGSDYLEVAILFLDFSQELLQTVAQSSALRKP